jgi:hypothetical protein
MSMMLICGHRNDWLCMSCGRCALCCKCEREPAELLHSNSAQGQQVMAREIRRLKDAAH